MQPLSELFHGVAATLHPPKRVDNILAPLKIKPLENSFLTDMHSVRDRQKFLSITVTTQ